MNIYTHRYSMTAADMDTRYRITPNAILLYSQDSWAHFMGCLNLAAFDIVKQNLMWVITEFNAWFESDTAYWSDDIEVTVWNSEISALRLYADFRIHKTNGAEIAHGYGCWTLLDTVSHRLAPNTLLPHPLPILPEMTTDSHKKIRFSSEGTLLQEVEHRVNPINLDFNGHVNNRTYLSIAMQSANEQFMDVHEIRRLTVLWLKESFLGDTLICRLTQLPREEEDDLFNYLHTITRAENEVAAQIYTEWGPRTLQVDVSAQAIRK